MPVDEFIVSEYFININYDYQPKDLRPVAEREVGLGLSLLRISTMNQRDSVLFQ